MNNNWTTEDEKALTSITEEPFKHPDFVPTERELRVQKHIARLQSADDMLADGQISRAGRDAIRDRMLAVIEVPGA